jgi:PAS domain S-box-containing protein
VDAAWFQVLVENAPDAIVVSREGIVLYANAAAAKLLGHDDVSTLVGRPMTFLDRQQVEVMRRRIAQMAQTGDRLIPREYPAKRRDGTEITAEIASTVIDWEGSPAILAYARDVTDRTRLRAQLAHSDRLASLGTMAAGVAHEINNPLTFMGLATEALARRVKSSELGLVKELSEGVDRITAIVRDLRFFGREDDEPTGPMDLAEAIGAAERLVHHEIRPRGTLTREYGELPMVVGIPRRIEQVFVNLFMNAVHALGDRVDGRITVRARVDDDAVVVTVHDDGGGISPEHLDAIFEPSFTTRSGTGGSGLGLSICRDIVVRAGGQLVAASAPGQGTTMTVTLRRATADAAPGVMPPSLRPESRRAAPLRRVLIVDDEAATIRLLAETLDGVAEVITESSPARALDLIRSDGTFHAIVCDVMMPGMSGVELHQVVAKERPEIARHFLFITGGTYTSAARDYLQQGTVPCLQKPFRRAQLIAAIDAVSRPVD